MGKTKIASVNVETTRTARCSVVGDPKSARTVWVCAHGYAQLAQFVARQFLSLASSQRAFVVPEALSRFYVDGTGGRVGASWMTSEDRESEIADYVSFMRSIRTDIVGDLADVVLLGYSQGAATASRWVAHDAVRPKALVLWAGTPAHDLTDEGLERVRRIPVRLLVVGDKDEYFDEARIDREIRRADGLGVGFEVIRFAGGHVIDVDVMREIVDRVENDGSNDEP